MKRKNMMWLAVVAGSVGLLGVGAVGYTYTYVGDSEGYWCGYDRWIRSGCGSPCDECPDTPDDAIFDTNGAIIESDVDIDDLTIQDALVQFGKNNALSCSEFYSMSFDSITITAGAGETAQLKGGNCTTTATD